MKTRATNKCGTKVEGRQEGLGAVPSAGSRGSPWSFMGAKCPMKLTTFYWYNYKFLHFISNFKPKYAEI